MSYLLVITFDDLEKAGQVREVLHQAQDEHLVRLDDSAVVVKDQDGAIHVKNEIDRGMKIGALGGGLLGLLIGFMLGGPIGGLLVGAVGGALGGDLANLGIDQRFINDVSEAMGAGTSALFVMIREVDPEEAIDALEPFEGQVYYTSFPTEVEDRFRQVLS